MEERLKQRLVGAIVLVSLAVVFVPMLLDTPQKVREGPSRTPIPERPQNQFESGSIPLDRPETPRLDTEVEREHKRYASSVDATSRRESTEGAASALARDSAEAPVPVSGSESSSARSGSVSPAREPGEPPGKKLAAASGGWAVQLGSFLKSKNALALRDRLRAEGYPAFIESGVSAQGTISRVFVGPVPDRGRAKDSAAKLQHEMRLEGIVVPYQGG